MRANPTFICKVLLSLVLGYKGEAKKTFSARINTTTLNRRAAVAIAMAFFMF